MSRLVRFRLDPDNPPELDPEELARLRAMTDEEVLAAALADPDAQPMTEAQLARIGRAHAVRRIRRRLGLTQAEFAARFHLPVEAVRDWELGRTEPDAAARVLLQVIDRDPDAVARALGPA
jgi:putative transcriptional regulator